MGQIHKSKSILKSGQVIAVVGLLALTACAPRAEEIFEATGEIGKVAGKADATLKTELNSASRALRIGYARTLLNGSPIFQTGEPAHQFATLACAGIPVFDSDANQTEMVRKQVAQLSAFHKSLGKFATKAKADSDRVEGAVSAFQSILGKTEIFSIAGTASDQIVEGETETFALNGNVSEAYVECFLFAVDNYRLGKKRTAESNFALSPVSSNIQTNNLVPAGVGVAVALELIQITGEFVVDASRDEALIAQIHAYLKKNECSIRQSLLIPRDTIKVTPKPGEGEIDPSPLMEARFRAACSIGPRQNVDLGSGIASNPALLNAMLERRKASLDIPSLTYDVITDAEVEPSKRSELALKIHDSFGEFDAVRNSGLDTDKFRVQLAQISYAMSNNLDGLKEITEQSIFDRVSGERIGSALRRLIGNVSKLGGLIEEFVPDTTK